MNSSAIEFKSERLVPERVTELTSAILLFIFFLVFILIDLGFYVEEAVNGGALVAALTETSVSRVDTCRTTACLLPLATTVRAFIIVIVIPFIIITIFLFLFVLFVPLFFLSSMFLVVFAAGVMERSFLRVWFISTLA
jgi:hypothetical protein